MEQLKENVNFSAEADCSTTEVQSEENSTKNHRGKLSRGQFNKAPYRNRDQRSSFSRDDNYITERLSLFTGSTANLEEVRQVEHKFSTRSRLFVANLPPKSTEDELQSLFKPFGETADLYINEAKNFAFVKLDYHANAERAKRELNGTNLRGKELLVKFAHINGILVKNLPPYVSNELLYHAFSIFGEIERCYILLDKNRKSKNKGIVEYAMKNSVALAIKRCSEGCYFITSSLKPLIVENYEASTDYDGLPESAIRKTADYYHAREVPPRFAKPATFEYDYAQRWKQLDTKYTEMSEKLKADRLYEQQKLEEEMRRAQFDYETERLKDMVRQREMESKHYKQGWHDMRPNLIVEKQTIPNENSSRIRQPDSLFIQANQLTNLLDREEQQLQEQWNRADNFSPIAQAKPNQHWHREADLGPDHKRIKRNRH